MEHFLLGGLLIGGPIAISGAITIACFVAMFVMLFRRAGWDGSGHQWREVVVAV